MHHAGACRQVISEFEIPHIIIWNLRGDYTVVELEGLLPFRFGNDTDNIKRDHVDVVSFVL